MRSFVGGFLLLWFRSIVALLLGMATSRRLRGERYQPQQLHSRCRSRRKNRKCIPYNFYEVNQVHLPHTSNSTSISNWGVTLLLWYVSILLFCYMQFLGTDDVVQESEKNTQLLDVINLGKRRRNRKQNTKQILPKRRYSGYSRASLFWLFPSILYLLVSLAVVE